MTKQIALVEDHAIVRAGLKMLIERLGDYRIMKEFDHGKMLLYALEQDLKFDLIIMDITMPEMGMGLRQLRNSMSLETIRQF